VILFLDLAYYKEDFMSQPSVNEKKYVAYVGSYSYTGEAKGITVYDVDMKRGCFIKRDEVEVDNSSYLALSHNKRVLYSIADEGIVSFNIGEDGSISRLNSAKIKGMRGCHLYISKEDKYIFVSGYHDAKLTMLSLRADGTVGSIFDAVYHRGIGSVVERNFTPHISRSTLTPEEKFVLACDLGIDQIKIYLLDKKEKRLVLTDSIRCELNSAPLSCIFSEDGRFLYVLYEQKNAIDVFSYNYVEGSKAPVFERIQTIACNYNNNPSALIAGTCMSFTHDFRYLFSGNAGDNTVSMFSVNIENGLLENKLYLPISGEYPKDIAVFPDDKHIASVNHESGTITFFKVDYEKDLIVMSANEVKVNQPNCCIITEV
jgi:hypothetical protein